MIRLTNITRWQKIDYSLIDGLTVRAGNLFTIEYPSCIGRWVTRAPSHERHHPGRALQSFNHNTICLGTKPIRNIPINTALHDGS